MPDYSVRGTVIICKDDLAYLSHPSVTVLEGGEWLAAFNHSRRREPSMHPPTDPLFRTLLTRSSDQGATWDAPTFAPDFGWSGTECPGIAQLSDGTVVLTQSRFGWYPLGLARKRRAAGEIIVRDDMRGWDIGYPTTIEYAPNRLFVCYYGEGSDGISCIQGSYVDLTS